ncbi:SusC/RagA family TonB-linked outer membrane protein [Mucilaginibacter ginsenosidivorax]|uniref:SusC/RagA family TonB-linked outer membrane protein n=1 Tax=Mucilaginibacter ginsenosidivorax TaxID=862126 RepID=A0A5B8W153_9SPHI|nr:SusC/RagA family TonB-linked outer membrane protein [Mucilaginibacter ginsenosidivorax]QEC75968.1 SusC/RagA family TonB-linked outer membrane protein [Mucilaginibacter ginsenosidivorax]
MKKLLLTALCLVVLFANAVLAQNKTITGTVISKDDGLPLPGVSVRVSGTTIGTQTGANGQFTLSVPGTAKSLVFSFTGFTSQTVEIGSSPIKVMLAINTNSLSEVIVTGAYGTRQTSRSASYAAQVVKSEALNTIREPNLNDALAGKVAGIQVRSQSAAALGRNTNIRLRGATGFGSGNNPLYVVDGTILPNSDDLSNDDIDNITVLQGPAASAQFGSQGAYGAIVITTKKGKKTSGLGVEINLGANFDKAYILPNYQNTYGGGASADFMQYTYKEGDPEGWKALNGKYYPDYTDDSSWGPKMVGQEYIPWYAWAAGTKYSFKTASWTAQPNNAKDYFQTGIALNNSFAFTKAADNYNIRMSYNNQNTRGILPSSNLNKNVFSLNVNYDLNKHFTVGASVNFVGQQLTGQINDAYASQSSGSFNSWFHRDLDMGIMKELQNLKSPDGTYVSWNHQNPTSYDASDPSAFYGGNYWYNFYTYANQINNVSQRDRLYGNFSLTYKINNDLSVKATYRKNATDSWYESKTSSELQYSGTQTGVKGGYATGTVYQNRENYETLVTYSKKISDFQVNANAGSDIFNYIYKDNTANTNNGLSIDDLYTIGNSVDAATVGNTRIQEQYRALFAKASVGYKSWLFADVTIRNDWFSTLSVVNNANSVLSKSFGGSFVFSELLPQTKSWLSFGKVRASYGEIPLALGTSTETFGAYRNNTTYSISSNKWNGNLLQAGNGVYIDPSLHGTTTKQTEFGLDLGFFNDRLTFAGTYYQGDDKDIPVSLSVNGASGVSTILTNIGLIKKRGVEFSLGGSPVKLPNFSWTVNTNVARIIENTVVEISDKYGVDRVAVAGVWGSTMPYLIQQKGKEWGQIYGNGIKRNADGVPILTSAGAYINDPNVYFGSVLPKFTGGLQNSFAIFKDFVASFNIDYQIGGKFVSLSNMWGQYSGLTANTAALNDKGMSVRDPVADGGGVKVTGVDANNNPVTYYVDAKTYYQGLYNNKTFDSFIYDLTFVKLREVAIGYNIPVKKLGFGKTLQSARFELTGRNLLLLYAKTKDFDPSEITASQGETAQWPGTRGFGFNLKVTF